MPLPILESLTVDCVRVRRKRLFHPELASVAFLTAHAHMTHRELATMIGATRRRVQAARHRMRPPKTPPPGSARQRIRERLTNNQRHTL
jgi:hypothetical protein